MNPIFSDNPTVVCENILEEEKRYNTDHHIRPSENAVADRLLRRTLELAPAYAELCGKLRDHPRALETFMDILLGISAGWNPDKIGTGRDTRKRLLKLNSQISRTAKALADLLQQRSEITNTSLFRADTHYHVCDVIAASATNNYRHQQYVREPLSRLRAEFDLEYWPTPSDFVEELSKDAETANAQASDPVTAAATKASRPSLADFFHAWFTSIEENVARNYGHLPSKLHLNDSTYAILANCALGLAPEDMVDSLYVKGLRQRERGRARLASAKEARPARQSQPARIVNE